MDRRFFLKNVFWEVVGIFSVKYFKLFAAEKNEILLGTIYDFPLGVRFLESGPDVLSGKAVKDLNLFAVRDERGIGIMSAKCTHRACVVEKVNDNFECPCHNSYFDKNGRVTQGPAKRDLVWYEARVTEGSQVFVNLAVTVEPEFRAQI